MRGGSKHTRGMKSEMIEKERRQTWQEEKQVKWANTKVSHATMKGKRGCCRKKSQSKQTNAGAKQVSPEKQVKWNVRDDKQNEKNKTKRNKRKVRTTKQIQEILLLLLLCCNEEDQETSFTTYFVHS